MTDKQVWLITGAGRGMGIDIARAALAAGHAVVGTARNAASVTAALGEHDELLTVPLDVTDPAAAEAAVVAAVERFGRLDVLVTTPAASTPVSSRKWPPRTSAPRSSPPSSDRSTSPAPRCRGCAPSAPG